MPRPKIYEDKKTTSLTISREILEKARDSGINISDICEKELTRLLGLTGDKEIAEEIRKIPIIHRKKIDKFVTEDYNRAEKWAEVTNDKFGTKLTKEDILNYVKRVK